MLAFGSSATYFKLLYGKVRGKRSSRAVALPIAYVLGELFHSMTPVGVWWTYNWIWYPMEAMAAWAAHYWICWSISWVVVAVGMIDGSAARRSVGGIEAVTPPEDWVKLGLEKKRT